jgi:ATP-dependent DNA helicase RecG
MGLPSPLDGSVQFLKGVGPRRAEALGRMGVHTVRDLLFHVPRRYEDASTVTPIARVAVGSDATVIGEVVDKGVLPTRKGLRIFQAVLRDRSGVLECSWPGQPFLERTMRRGDLLLATGPVRFFHGKQMQPREFVVLGRADETQAGGKVLPIYPATEGLSQKVVRAVVEQNLDRHLPLLQPAEVFPRAQLEAAGVPTLMQAVALLHRPERLADAERGRRRLAYEELFFLQLLHALAAEREAGARAGIAFHRTDRLVGALYRSLPFELTGAQTRALREIFGDMSAPVRMNRMLQGDVGSGKTVVALLAMLLAVENRFQAALMAPTEVLAEQHARTLRVLLGDSPVNVELLTGGLGTVARAAARERIAAGEAALVVGTHALIQEGVRWHRLGLVIVDEQHRFGVRQRLALADESVATESTGDPDVLVMSATPIPRSLALTLYGDLELSVLDERPPGRLPVRTVLRPLEKRGAVHAFVREQLAAGQQAYLVYPLVDASEKVDARAATEEHARLSAEVFPDFRVGLLHGQLAGEEKEAVMRAFVAGELNLLVATTVIEVGIDVPAATVMVIEHAERFGLSQLHQLRGRVGRGAHASYCILLSAGGEARERLQLFAATEDGFAIARADLRLRGMGDFFGARQHGLPELRFFDPELDEDLLMRARADARATVAADPGLEDPDHAGLAAALRARWAERARLYDVG